MLSASQRLMTNGSEEVTKRGYSRQPERRVCQTSSNITRASHSRSVAVSQPFKRCLERENSFTGSSTANTGYSPEQSLPDVQKAPLGSASMINANYIIRLNRPT